jgi:hypothetical protein
LSNRQLISRRYLLFSAALLAGCRPRPEIGGPEGSGGKPNPPTIVSAAQANAAKQLTRAPLRFTDITGPAGVKWHYTSGATGKHHFIESTGGGVALFDYNNDGLLDIFAVQGGTLPGDPAAHGTPPRNVLYRNNGDGTFTDVTAGSGLDVETGYGQGVSIADFDNDGFSDIYVTASGGNHLFRNNGNGTFTDVTARAGVADAVSPGLHEAPWPLSAAWADYDNDGRLDLFVCHYCRWTPALDKECPDAHGNPAYCRPQVYEPSHCRLYHNNGDGTFTDVTDKSGIGKLQGKSMGAAWFDYDDDGWMDLFVTNDTMVNFLLHNNRDGTFTDKGIISGVGYGEQDAPSSGMGIGVGDYDNDGREDLFIVNFSGQSKTLFHNLGHGIFENASAQAGLASTNLQYLGFGLECFDYDLDGRKDLIFGNGHVLDGNVPLELGSSYAQSQQLFHNQGDGTFAEDTHSLGDLAIPRVTRGLGIGDIDNDGDIDVVMVSQTGPLQIYRNDGGNQSHWITLRLEGVKSNRDAIGAKVVVRTAAGAQTQWVRGGSSYCSQSDRRVTFGLGDAAGITALEIRWPRGLTQKFGPLAAGRFYHVQEGREPVTDPRIRAR